MAEKYTADQVVKAISDAKGMVSVAAKSLNCDRTTIYRYINKHKAVAQAVEDARESLIDFAEGKLFEQMKAGNVTAIIFYLKTQGKDRGYIERQELTGRNGSPLVQFVWDDDDDNSGHSTD